MRDKKLINYPKTVNRLFETAKGLCETFIEEGDYRLINLLAKTSFPKGARFQVIDLIIVEEKRLNGVMFSILLPSGEIFSGVAIRKDGDPFDMMLPPLIAASRAIKVYERHFIKYEFPILGIAKETIHESIPMRPWPNKVTLKPGEATHGTNNGRQYVEDIITNDFITNGPIHFTLR